MKKIAIIGLIHEDGINLLKENKYEVIEIEDFSNENLKKKLPDVDAIIIRTPKLDRDVLEFCKSLKIVSRHGVGYDNVDFEFLKKNNIALAITGTSNSVSVAEHVMTMFLTLCKLIKISDKLVRDGKFTEKKTIPDFFELYNKKVLILGFGRIGKSLAKRCKGFESEIYICDPYIDSKVIEDLGYIPIKFNEGIKLADFISIHLPLTNETKNLITKDSLSMMKKNCILVNTSRGQIINEDDLIWALDNKVIFAAGLDVYEIEPPKANNKLFSLDNVILSPHNAALTLECRKRMAFEACENVINFFQNKEKLNISNIVNKDFLKL